MVKTETFPQLRPFKGLHFSPGLSVLDAVLMKQALGEPAPFIKHDGCEDAEPHMCEIAPDCFMIAGKLVIVQREEPFVCVPFKTLPCAPNE